MTNLLKRKYASPKFHPGQTLYEIGDFPWVAHKIDINRISSLFLKQSLVEKIRHFKFHPGQTLMEALIGVGVMGIILTGIAGVVAVSLQSVRITREKSMAQSLINDTAAAVKGLVQTDWHDLWSSANGVSYWSFDDGASAAGNNTAGLDYISGNNSLLTIGSGGSNSTIANAWLSGTNCRAGGCISLDGTDDYASSTDSSTLEGMSAITLSVWVKIDTLPASSYNYAPIEKMGSVYRLIIDSAGQVHFAVRTTNNGWYTAGTTATGGTIGTGSWAHLAGTYDGSYVRMYLNGVQTATGSQTISGTIASSTNTLTFGYATAANVSYLDGIIDEARLYNQALSSTEISNLYTGINSLYPTNLLGVWQIKEGKKTQTIGNIDFTRSFAFEPVQRDGSNNIITSGGTDDPLTKKAVYTVTWRDQTLSSSEYIFRETDSVFTQTNWSGGLTSTTTVFTAPNGFLAASSGIVYSTSGSLTNQLGQAASSSIDSTYRYAWSDQASWFDFYPVEYSPATAKFMGLATSSLSSLSLSCQDLSICGTSNYQVYQKTSAGSGYAEGELYGYGWSDAFGWMSFNCNQTGVGGSNTCATVNYKVSITTSTGDFNGYSWSDVIGWVSYNCADLSICGTSNYKVKLNPGSGGASADFLESLIFDTQIENGAVPVSIVWQGSLGTDSQVKFQIASSNSESGPWNFIGNDGTTSSYYPGSSTAQPNTSVSISKKYHFNHRYLRYKIYLTSSATGAPTVEDVSIIWKQ
jgi:hypothetical protein